MEVCLRSSRLALRIIEHLWVHRKMMELQVMEASSCLDTHSLLLSLDDCGKRGVASALVFSIMRRRDVARFHVVMAFLEETHRLFPALVTAIKHMKIMFGIKTMVVMAMLREKERMIQTVLKIIQFFPKKLPEYQHQCSPGEMYLMRKNHQDFKDFALVLALDKNRRHHYIQTELQEQYGERYAQKVEDRLLQYLQQLEVAQPADTYVDKIMNKSRSVTEEEKLLLDVRTCDYTEISSTLKKLLHCDAASCPSVTQTNTEMSLKPCDVESVSVRGDQDHPPDQEPCVGDQDHPPDQEPCVGDQDHPPDQEPCVGDQDHPSDQEPCDGEQDHPSDQEPCVGDQDHPSDQEPCVGDQDHPPDQEPCVGDQDHPSDQEPCVGDQDHPSDQEPCVGDQDHPSDQEPCVGDQDHPSDQDGRRRRPQFCSTHQRWVTSILQECQEHVSCSPLLFSSGSSTSSWSQDLTPSDLVPSPPQTETEKRDGRPVVRLLDISTHPRFKAFQQNNQGGGHRVYKLLQESSSAGSQQTSSSPPPPSTYHPLVLLQPYVSVIRLSVEQCFRTMNYTHPEAVRTMNYTHPEPVRTMNYTHPEPVRTMNYTHPEPVRTMNYTHPEPVRTMNYTHPEPVRTMNYTHPEPDPEEPDTNLSFDINDLYSGSDGDDSLSQDSDYQPWM